MRTSSDLNIAISQQEDPLAQRIWCYMNRIDDQRGDNVQVTVRNISNQEVAIADRVIIDSSFATIERESASSDWQAIELYAVANILLFKSLKPNESRVYVWPTIGYNRSDARAEPGMFRIRFSSGSCTNQFEIQAGQ